MEDWQYNVTQTCLSKESYPLSIMYHLAVLIMRFKKKVVWWWNIYIFLVSEFVFGTVDYFPKRGPIHDDEAFSLLSTVSEASWCSSGRRWNKGCTGVLAAALTVLQERESSISAEHHHGLFLFAWHCCSLCRRWHWSCRKTSWRSATCRSASWLTVPVESFVNTNSCHHRRCADNMSGRRRDVSWWGLGDRAGYGMLMM